MIIPIRCFTCNKVIAHLWEEYLNKIQEKYIEDNIPEDTKKRFIDIDTLRKKTIEGQTLDKMNITKYCCRRMMLSHVDLCEII
jgi:DNA-directed RNA polymerase subunit N (RpoN/RPB10)|tara:strand:+ start:580 stop:828 length:249 start_codon:yes stop_codon:yes gene_type:complete